MLPKCFKRCGYRNIQKKLPLKNEAIKEHVAWVKKQK